MNKNISKRSLGVRSMLERLFGRRLLKQTFSQKIVSQKASRKQFSRIKILLALSLVVAVVTGLSMQALKQNQASAYESTEFVTRWTDLPAGVLTINLHGNNNGFYLDWGDGQSTVVTNASQISHDYQNPGTYDITIKLLNGAANHFNGWTLQDNRKAEYLTDVLHWGDNLKLSNTSYMFYGAINLNSFPNISPNTTEEVFSMSHMFYGAIKFNRSVNFNTSRVMDMSSMFTGAKTFNQSVNFNTSKVTDMSNMFAYAEAFNQSVNFDTSKVTNMNGMFCEARSFNQPINFDTSKVTNMNGMFQDAGNFNKPLNFDTKNVTNMRDMFAGAKAFNQDLSSLDFAAAQTIEHFVSETKLSTKNYDKLLKKWHTQLKGNPVVHQPKSDNLKYCTAEAEHDYLKNTKNWVFNDSKHCPSAFTTRWTDLPAKEFFIALHGDDNNLKIDWGDGTPVETKTNVSALSHDYATTGTREIKIYASEAGQKFNGWKLTGNSKAKYLTHVLNWGNVKFTNMSHMFEYAEKLNSFPTQAPDTSEVTSMKEMFNGAAAFNQPVNFNTSKVTDMSDMFSGAAAFNQPINFNTSKVTNMSHMFSGTYAFNQPVNFDTSKVTNMSYMFYGTSVFNKTLNFDTSNVTDMKAMFYDTKVFNQPVNFNTSQVTDMSYMFYGAKAFNQDLSVLDFTAVQTIEHFVSNSKLSVTNYDKLLKKWHNQFKDQSVAHLPRSIGLKYCKAVTEHDFLKNTKNWQFEDTKDCSEFNLAPTDITLSNTQINENNAPNFELADITITNDPNDIPNDTNTASLTCATAGADDASFQIAGNKLILKPSADFETKNKYNICVRATDSFGKTKDKNFTIDVRDLNETPTIANRTFTIAENSANGTELGQVVATDPDAGQSLTYQIVSGNDLGIFEITNDGKLKVKDNTKLDYEQHQSVTLRVKVTDNGTPALHAEADITINITDVNEAPNWTSADQITINEDATSEHTLTATDPENNPLAYSVDGSLPSWITLVNNKLTFNPTQSAVGNHNIKLKVSDGTNQTTQTLKVTVKNVNDAPVWTSANTITMNEKATLEHNLTATDEDGDSLTYSADSLPSWITLANNKLTLKPRASEIGTHTITVKVSDGTVAVPQTITITVKNVNDAPVITSAPNETTAKGEQYSYTITATDEDSDPLTFAVTAKPDWLTFDTTTRTLSGTPGNSEVGQTYSITLTVSDGTATTTQTFNLIVNDKNYAPTIANQAFSIAENSANGTELGQVVATDPDAGQSLTYQIVSGNDLNIFEITNDGKLKVKDNAKLDYEQHQSVTLRVKATDNGTPALTAEADVTVNITDVDDEAPTITVEGGTAPREITVGETFNAPSATCHDNQGNCTLTVANSVDTTTAGDYQVTYTAIDDAGNRTVVTIAVKVKALVQPGNQGNQGNQSNQGGQNQGGQNSGNQGNQGSQGGQTNSSTDNNKPPFTINGQPEITINQGDEYVEPGVTCAPGTSCSVEITGKVNSKVPGTYTITYKTTDANGKVTTVTRKITVRGANDKTTSANANTGEKKTFGAKLKQIYAKYLFWWWWIILLIIAYRLYRRWQKQRQSRNATSSRRLRC